MKPLRPRIKTIFRQFWSRVVQNWTYKILSILITFGIFFYVMGEQVIEVGKSIPLEFRLPAQLVIVNEVPASVEFRFSGPKLSVEDTLRRNESIVLDLKTAKPGFLTYKIDPEMIVVGRSVRIRSVSPSWVTLKLEERVDKK